MPVIGPPRTKADLLKVSRSRLAELLPAGWRLDRRPTPYTAPGRADDVVEVVSPEGVNGRIVVEAKPTVQGRDVDSIRDQLQRWLELVPRSVGGLLVARYLSPPVRERLAAADVSYMDVTGNVRVSLSTPGLFISTQGADRDPWRGPGRPRGNLKGAPAAKVVRSLLDFDRVWSVRELVMMSKASIGSVYRVVDFLEEEGLITREGPEFALPDWQPLLRRWSTDYGFVSSNRVTRWLAPRGLPRLLEQVAENTYEDYVITGTVAAAEWAAYAPARSAMIYARQVHLAADAWDLRAVEAGTNVMLAEPESDVVFDRRCEASVFGKYYVATPPQVAVDLLTGPGRNPSEAEELINWMTRDEKSWRQQL